MTRTAPPALISLVLAAVLLSGCTSDFLTGEGGSAVPSPSPSGSAVETPTAAPAPTTPAEQFDCDDVLINRPGNYVLGECGTVTLEGTGIDLAFTSIAHLVIRGDNLDIVGDEIGEVEISGQGSEIEARTIDDVVIRGNNNAVTAEESIGTASVNGNENVVSAGEGIGSSTDNGLLNEIS